MIRCTVCVTGSNNVGWSFYVNSDAHRHSSEFSWILHLNLITEPSYSVNSSLRQLCILSQGKGKAYRSPPWFSTKFVQMLVNPSDFHQFWWYFCRIFCGIIEIFTVFGDWFFPNFAAIFSQYMFTNFGDFFLEFFGES